MRPSHRQSAVKLPNNNYTFVHHVMNYIVVLYKNQIKTGIMPVFLFYKTLPKFLFWIHKSILSKTTWLYTPFF